MSALKWLNETVVESRSALDSSGSHPCDDLLGGDNGEDDRRNRQQATGCHDHAPIDVVLGE